MRILPVVATTMMIAGALATGPAPAHAAVTGDTAANIELVHGGGGGFHGGGGGGGGGRR
jgi:hypothetical protein